MSPNTRNELYTKTWTSHRLQKLGWDSLELMLGIVAFVGSDGLALPVLIAASTGGAGVVYDLAADDVTLAQEEALEPWTSPRAIIFGAIGSLIPSVGFDTGAKVGAALDKGKDAFEHPRGVGDRYIRDAEMMQFIHSANEARESFNGSDKHEPAARQSSPSQPLDTPSPKPQVQPAPAPIPSSPSVPINGGGRLGGPIGPGPRGGGPTYGGGGGNPSDHSPRGPLGEPGGFRNA